MFNWDWTIAWPWPWEKVSCPTDSNHFWSLIHVKSHSTVFNLRCKKRCVNIVNFTQNNSLEVVGSHLEDPRGVKFFRVFSSRRVRGLRGSLLKSCNSFLSQINVFNPLVNCPGDYTTSSAHLHEQGIHDSLEVREGYLCRVINMLSNIYNMTHLLAPQIEYFWHK